MAGLGGALWYLGLVSSLPNTLFASVVGPSRDSYLLGGILLLVAGLTLSFVGRTKVDRLRFYWWRPPPPQPVLSPTKVRRAHLSTNGNLLVAIIPITLILLLGIFTFLLVNGH